MRSGQRMAEMVEAARSPVTSQFPVAELHVALAVGRGHSAMFVHLYSEHDVAGHKDVLSKIQRKCDGVVDGKCVLVGGGWGFGVLPHAVLKTTEKEVAVFVMQISGALPVARFFAETCRTSSNA